jgi:hypothetical protein
MLIMVGFVGVQDAAAASGQQFVATTFNSTGKAQTWKVPAHVFSAAFDVYGAQGGNGGGRGGEATATISVTPGEVLQINVGNAKAFNGGGFGFGKGGWGGGASDVRTGAFKLANRRIVGGGGGGRGQGTTGAAIGGSGGGSSGGGDAGGGVCTSDFGGGGATQTRGGLGGEDCFNDTGQSGSLGQGGQAGNGETGGGGGGGGLYGGGGGVSEGSSVPSGSGGGGSGFGPSGVVFHSGVRAGNGLVIVSYLTGTVRSGTLSITPSSGFPGTVIDVFSQTPCPAGTNGVAMSLDDLLTGRVIVTNAKTFLDAAGNWAGTLTVPQGILAGGYGVTAACATHGLQLQDYAFVPFQAMAPT